jgi:alpha-1,2-mannosyltransferase
MASSIRRRPHATSTYVAPTIRTDETNSGAKLVPRFDSVPHGHGRHWFRRYRSKENWTPDLILVMATLCCVRIFGAFRNGIADCDETYNYWEPLHYLLYGKGLQTWEYSPEFAIRSYAFLYPYAAVARAASLISSRLSHVTGVSEKIAAFYAVRSIQGLTCALAETAVYDSTVFRFGARVARLFFAFTIMSPGIFRASTELLPSSFAMIAFMFATSQWLEGSFPGAVFFVAAGSLLGWPFSALLGAPIALHALHRKGLYVSARLAVVSGLGILCFMVPIDSWYFGKFVIAPLNIVLYNVFPEEGAGPNIFGTEPLSFYITNLVLNCNVTFLLLAFTPVLVLLDLVVSLKSVDRGAGFQGRLARLVYFSPCFLWLFIFFSQEHKEERFLAPVYPLIALIAAVVLDDLSVLLSRGAQTFVKLGNVVKFCVVIGAVVGTAAFGVSRICMQLHGFGGPISVFKTLSEVELRRGTGPRHSSVEGSRPGKTINICVGKEWHRFPSSFFVPNGAYDIRFVSSSFTGLLPKYFAEGRLGSRAIPPGMNMFNAEDPNQYIANASASCHYFVDLDLSHRQNNSNSDFKLRRDENPIEESARLKVASEKFLDSESSKPGFRAFWVPWISNEDNGNVVYGAFEVSRNLALIPVTSDT